MVSGGNASSLPLVGGASEPTIRELSRPGRRASKYPKLDVPEVDFNHPAMIPHMELILLQLEWQVLKLSK